MHCHGNDASETPDGRPVVLIGNPNVGKSAIFSAFTGRYVEVSNYPGTTVELTRGRITFDGTETTLIDTPGVQSLLPRSDDERVTRDVLFNDSPPWAVIQVAEREIPFVLALNMADEADSLDIRVNAPRLSQILGADVVRTVATRREGIDDLRACLRAPRKVAYRNRYDGLIENAVTQIEEILPETLNGRRGLALMALAGDIPKALGSLPNVEGLTCIREIVAETAAKYSEPLGYAITRQRLKCADCLLAEVWQAPASRRTRMQVR